MRRSIIKTVKGLLEPSQSAAGQRDPLANAVHESLPEADEDTRRMIAAVAGILACVAYADSEYSEPERQQIRRSLGRIQGLGSDGVLAICGILDSDIALVVSGGDHAWVRDLKESTNHEQRLDVLDVLMELAAADDDVSMAETNYLRRLAGAFGLSQADYLEVQSRHRSRLSLLRD